MAGTPGYWDRLWSSLKLTNPLLLFTSAEELQRCKALLQAHGESSATSKELERARLVVQSCTHPVTGETIFPLFRMGAVAPVNIPIVAGMLQTPPSAIGRTLFWQWINQSYNTACNVANASSPELDYISLVSAYCLAVSASCAIALASGRLVTHGPAAFHRLGPLVPFSAVSAANVANVLFSRVADIRNGVPVWDEDGCVRGRSKIAGFQGVEQTILSRALVVPAACILLPWGSTSGLRYANMMPRSPAGIFALEIAVIYLSASIAVPAAMAVFPQDMLFAAEELEGEFQALQRKNGSRVEVFTANKGL